MNESGIGTRVSLALEPKVPCMGRNRIRGTTAVVRGRGGREGFMNLKPANRPVGNLLCEFANPITICDYGTAS